VSLRLNLLYNWKDNADEGRTELQTKATSASTWWSSQQQQWQNWNSANPTQQFPPPPDYYCGNASTSGPPQYLCNTDPTQVPGPRYRLTAQNPPGPGSHPFQDGITLKMYNGACWEFHCLERRHRLGNKQPQL
jgi:hypothetical protein